ncbi:cobalt ECF transporter T component CbiQ, partial [Streptomyces sp. NPDC058667]
MGTGHAHKLYRHARSPVHELPPHTKLAAVLGFVVVVVSTPRATRWGVAPNAPRGAGGGAQAPGPPRGVDT